MTIQYNILLHQIHWETIFYKCYCNVQIWSLQLFTYCIVINFSTFKDLLSADNMLGVCHTMTSRHVDTRLIPWLWRKYQVNLWETHIASVPLVTWCTTNDRFNPAAGYILIQRDILSGSDENTRRRTYYWPPPPTMEMKVHSKE